MTDIRPAFAIRVRVTSPCAWEGQEGAIERVETGGEGVVHVLIDGEDQSRQFYDAELEITSVGSGS